MRQKVIGVSLRPFTLASIRSFWTDVYSERQLRKRFAQIRPSMPDANEQVVSLASQLGYQFTAEEYEAAVMSEIRRCERRKAQSLVEREAIASSVMEEALLWDDLTDDDADPVE